MNIITIRVPATTANIGPGFDCLGLALSLYNEVTFRRSGEELLITGCPPAYSGADNLAYRAYLAVADRLGQRVEGLHIHINARIPISRGLGSSASLLAAGALGANALFGSPLSREELLAITTAIEGHPDNLAPAFFGGLVASTLEGDRPVFARFSLHSSWRLIALIPDFPLSTSQARRVLPRQVPIGDAVFNTAHALLLIKALETGDGELLSHALQDRLHQPFRKDLICDYAAVRELVTGAGGALCISGAGPTLLGITKEAGLVQLLARELPLRTRHSWQVLPLQPQAEGAEIETTR